MIFSHWLNKPYPQIEVHSTKIAISFLIGLTCFIFLLVFKPFGLDKVENLLIFAGFGLNAMVAVLLNYFLLPLLFPAFYHSTSWSIKRELLFFVSILVMISFFNYVYNSTLGKDVLPQYGFLSFLYMSSMVGILPILLMTYLTEIVARRRNELHAKGLKISENRNIDTEEQSVLQIEDESIGTSKLSIPLSSFLYARSSNNYCEIYYSKGEEIQKCLFRLSLKNLSDQVKNYAEIVRCHKSYLINKSNIIKVSGNARSLEITIRGIGEGIPVSRSFNKELLF